MFDVETLPGYTPNAPSMTTAARGICQTRRFQVPCRSDDSWASSGVVWDGALRHPILTGANICGPASFDVGLRRTRRAESATWDLCGLNGFIVEARLAVPETRAIRDSAT
jgi:hypothetical protein